MGVFFVVVVEYCFVVDVVGLEVVCYVQFVGGVGLDVYCCVFQFVGVGYVEFVIDQEVLVVEIGDVGEVDVQCGIL